MILLQGCKQGAATRGRFANAESKNDRVISARMYCGRSSAVRVRSMPSRLLGDWSLARQPQDEAGLIHQLSIQVNLHSPGSH